MYMMSYWIFILSSIFGVIFSNADLTKGEIKLLLDRCNDTSGIEGSIASLGTALYPMILPAIYSTQPPSPISTYNQLAQMHQTKASLGFKYMQKYYIVKLQLNRELIIPQSSSRSNIEDNHPRAQNCYYQGVFDEPDSVDDFVTISTCQGIRGVMKINGKMFEINPIGSAPDSQVCWPHVLTVMPSVTSHSCANTASQWKTFSQLHSTEYYRRLSSATNKKIKRNLDSKSLKLALVVDVELSAKFSHNNTRIQNYLLTVTNLLDLYYQRLNIRVGLATQEIWRVRDAVEITSNVREIMQSFITYARRKSPGRQYDVIHLLSGKSFQDHSVGLSIPDSICTDRAVAVISANALSSDVSKLASTLAHMIGHNIGLQHDTPDCECKDSSGTCIMSDDIGDSTPYLFSSCSSHRLQLLTRVGLGQCLNSGSVSDAYPQKCGNGMIERGEQCDPGPHTAGLEDPCCDASTCLLKSWAACRTGECCSNCLPTPAENLCRPATDDCDAPEYCDGMSGKCPTDSKIQDGQPCKDGEGFCYQGRCPMRSQQCKLLWGRLSTSSADACYTYHNPKGNVLGHCGLTFDGYYRRCPPRDAYCGSLQCDGGNSSPIVPDVDYRKTSTNEHADNAGEISCKTVNSKPDSDHILTGMVLDGTKCGEYHLCQSHQCISVQSLHTPGCPISQATNTTCSGNGRCTTDKRCLCYSGYSGKVCETVIVPSTTTSSITEITGNVADELKDDSALPRGAVAGVIVAVLLLVIAVIVVIFMQRKRKACFTQEKKHSHKYNVNQNPSSIISTNQDTPVTGVCYTIPSSHYNFSGRRQRRRRRRYQSSSSDDSSEEDLSNETNLPFVIYEVPDTGQPKSILKKAQVACQRSECSDSQCSCDNYSSSDSLNCNKEQVKFTDDRLADQEEYRLPQPDDSLSCAEVHIADHEMQPTGACCSVPNYDSSGPVPVSVSLTNSPTPHVGHDSASDSAIDSNTPSESSASNRTFPSQSNYSTPITTTASPTFQTSTPVSIPDDLYNTGSRATQTPIGVSRSHCTPTTLYTTYSNDSTLERFDPTGESAETESLLSSRVDNSPAFNLYSARPHNGPMRTFRPTQSISEYRPRV